MGNLSYLEFRCPSTDPEGKSCNGLIPGCSLELLAISQFHDFPMKDVGYCPSCRHFVEIEIRGSVATLTPLEKGKYPQFRPAQDVLTTIKVQREHALPSGR